jgi:hypothetical protein
MSRRMMSGTLKNPITDSFSVVATGLFRAR